MGRFKTHEERARIHLKKKQQREFDAKKLAALSAVIKERKEKKNAAE
jgi:hypothetical protein